MHYLGRGLHCTPSFLHSPQDTTLLQMPVGDWYKSLFFPALLPHTWQDSRSSPPSQTSYHRLKLNWLSQFHGIRVDTIFEFNHHFSTSGFFRDSMPWITRLQFGYGETKASGYCLGWNFHCVQETSSLRWELSIFDSHNISSFVTQTNWSKFPNVYSS